jgi:hemerythrin superfamily protein
MATKKAGRIAKPARTKRTHAKAASSKRKSPKTQVGAKPERASKRSAAPGRTNGKTGARIGRGNKAPGSTNALALLESDHNVVRKLFAQIEATNAADRQTALLQRLERELKLHTHLEEEIFYPAFRERARKNEDLKLYFEALEEHHAVDIVLPEVKDTSPGTPQFAARVKVLKEIVEHHAEEEERDLFPRARSLMDEGMLRRVGRRIVEEKESAGSSMLEKIFF